MNYYDSFPYRIGLILTRDKMNGACKYLHTCVDWFPYRIGLILTRQTEILKEVMHNMKFPYRIGLILTDISHENMTCHRGFHTVSV